MIDISKIDGVIYPYNVTPTLTNSHFLIGNQVVWDDERTRDDMLATGKWSTMPYDEYSELQTKLDAERYLRGTPTQIDKETYKEAFNILPPMRWTRLGSTEYFLMCERLTADITSMYFKNGSEYYSTNVRTSYTTIQLAQIIASTDNYG